MKKHTTLKSKFNSAFSLVELLVVIAVIAVIAAIAIPNITGARQAAEGARDSYNTATIDRMVTQAQALGATTNQITTLQGGGAITITNTNVTPNTTITLDPSSGN